MLVLLVVATLAISKVDPVPWKETLLALWNAGGWTVPALLALYIICRYPPWRKRPFRE